MTNVDWFLKTDLALNPLNTHLVMVYNYFYIIIIFTLVEFHFYYFVKNIWVYVESMFESMRDTGL